MQINEVARLAEALPGVRRTTQNGLAQWRYHGRLVARQIDDASKQHGGFSAAPTERP
jgi:hypothetical protein